MHVGERSLDVSPVEGLDDARRQFDILVRHLRSGFG
jgi:hypothetical protein